MHEVSLSQEVVNRLNFRGGRASRSHLPQFYPRRDAHPNFSVAIVCKFPAPDPILNFRILETAVWFSTTGLATWSEAGWTYPG